MRGGTETQYENQAAAKAQHRRRRADAYRDHYARQRTDDDNAAIGFKKGRILPPRLADSYLALLIEGIYYSICLNAE